MTLSITHPFVCALSDDSTALAAGEVVPSKWNQALSMTGVANAISGFDGSGNATDATALYAASGVVSLANSTNAQALRVYNTVDSIASPTNYERGIIDWSLTANVLTIGTQQGGTGSARNIKFQAGTTVTYPPACFVVSGGGGLANTLALIAQDAGSNHYSIISASSSAIAWNSGTDVTSGGIDTTVSRVAAGVLAFGGAAPNTQGWMQWRGEARVSADISVTSNATPNTTALSVGLTTGRTYSFYAFLIFTCIAAGGVSVALGNPDTLTSSQLNAFGYVIDLSAAAIKGCTNITALNGSMNSALASGTVGAVAISGTITVTNGGSFAVQFGQAASNATATVVKRGSFMWVYDMP